MIYRDPNATTMSMIYSEKFTFELAHALVPWEMRRPSRAFISFDGEHFVQKSSITGKIPVRYGDVSLLN